MAGAKQAEGFLSKSTPVVLVMLTTILSIVLVAHRHSCLTDNAFQFVNARRDTIGILVQVVASVLGACQVCAITAIFNYAVRLRLQQTHSISLQLLRFYTSITNASAQALRLSLPSSLLTLLVIVFLALRVPAALWAGALTPIDTEVVRNDGHIQVATYAPGDLVHWQSSFSKDEKGDVSTLVHCNSSYVETYSIYSEKRVNAIALVSTCPSVDHTSALIGGLSTASRAAPRIHARIENTGWNYVGRSYGVGASPGMVALKGLPNWAAPIQWLRYNETGYETIVKCTKNVSSGYKIVQGNAFNETWSKNDALLRQNPSQTRTYMINGTLPNSLPGIVEKYFLSTKRPADGDQSVFAWSTLSNRVGSMLAVAGQGWYDSLDQIQCTAQFKPALFSVHVAAANTTINVTRIASSASDIEPTGNFSQSVFYSLEQMARMSSLTIVSNLGHGVMKNAGLLNSTERNSISEKSDLGTDVNSQAVADSVVSLIDDLLVANAQSQLLLVKHSKTVPLSAAYDAIKLGSNKYLVAVLVSNLAVLALVVEECIRTRFWKDLTAFDFSDTPDVAIAASRAGKSIAMTHDRERVEMPGSKGEGRVRDTLRMRLIREFGQHDYMLVSTVTSQDVWLDRISDAGTETQSLVRASPEQKLR